MSTPDLHRLDAETAAQQHAHRIRLKEQALLRAAVAWVTAMDEGGESSEAERTALRFMRYSATDLRDEQAKG